MQPRNLFELLEAAAENQPDNGLLFYLPGKVAAVGRHLKYPELLQQSRENAQTLKCLNLAPGTIVILHFNNHLDNIRWFWAVTCAGYLPTLSTPFAVSMEQRQKHIEHLHSVLKVPIWLTTKELLPEFASQDTVRPFTVDDIPNLVVNGHSEPREFAIDTAKISTGDALAVLMLTSGSTGNAKAVCLTHKQILRAISSKSLTHHTKASGPFLNWIGVDHVACLTEIHLHAMWVGADQIYVQAADLVPNPLLFLDLINKHMVAHSFAPNFFLASVRRALEAPEGGHIQNTLDLTCLHTIVTGGEANVVETCNALTQLLRKHGAPVNVLSPAFGMTETCGGSIYSKDCPRRDLECNNEFATVGASIPGMEMRIADDAGQDLGLNVSGNLEVRGQIVFAQYYNNSKATAESFNEDWFMTGDRGSIDCLGQLTITGRTKETVIINGIHHFPHEIESALEGIPGAKPSFTVVFAHRPKGSQTESLCIVYLPTYTEDNIEARLEATSVISKIVMLQTSVRPCIIPLDETKLQKSTLGKFSRAKIRTAFEKGEFAHYQTLNDEAISHYRANTYEGPANATEELVQKALLELFDLSPYDLGVNTNLFVMGVNSIDIIRIKQKLQERLDIENIPVLTIMTNPSIRAMSTAIESLQKPHTYDPMVVLQSQGEKAPLWLIHPGVGEVLVFLPLASWFTDRPIYAMRARGFEQGEDYFSAIEEIVTTYYEKIKRVQPQGPYAIAGYSFGSMIAFEVTKRLRKGGDEIKFLGALNLPPHIKFRMRQLDWTNCLLHLSYFLDFFTEEYAHTMLPALQKVSRDEALQHVTGVAPKDRMAELGLDEEKLRNWADLAYSLQSAATDYEPSEMVDSIDVFCAVPLAAVARNMEDWKTNHLGKWSDFSETKPKMHDVDGAHYTMISPTHVYSFQKRLKAALADRGI